MHRFYVPPATVEAGPLGLSGGEAHHALHVVRVRVGERITLMDGAGHELLCEVTGTGRHNVDVAVRQRVFRARPALRLTLLQAMTKARSMDLIIQKATELAATRIVPIQSERSVTRLDAGEAARKVEKWRAVAIEALKQCGVPWLPEIEPPQAPAAYLARAPRFTLMLLASLQPGARHPRDVMSDLGERHARQGADVALWIGPEGDFAPAELELIQAAGVVPISLGPLVLRSETAALYGLSVLSYELQGLAGSRREECPGGDRGGWAGLAPGMATR